MKLQLDLMIIFFNIGPTEASITKSEGLSNRSFLHNDLYESFFLEPTNELEIMNIISHLKKRHLVEMKLLPET